MPNETTPNQMNEAQVAKYIKWLETEIHTLKGVQLQKDVLHSDILNAALAGQKTFEEAKAKFLSLLSSSSTTGVIKAKALKSITGEWVGVEHDQEANEESLMVFSIPQPILPSETIENFKKELPHLDFSELELVDIEIKTPKK